METVKRDIIQEYAGWSSLDVLENANRYPGPTGFFAYVMEEALTAGISLVPKEGREAHFSGDIYIHKLPYSLYIPYCTGHSTARLLEKGLKTPTIVSRPARHFDTYVDHIANYLITMQHYFSGAQALSSVEWYAGSFIRKESLNRRKIRQQIQRLVYNLNYPSRVGMQCLSEDTVILTPYGWKRYNEINVGDVIYTFNVETRKIEPKVVRHVHISHYSGKMYNLRNRTQDQLISPRHRVVRKVFNSDRYTLTPIEEVVQFKSPVPIPTPAVTELESDGVEIDETWIKLLAWILSEGSIEKKSKGTARITIVQSPESHPKEYQEILDILSRLGLEYTIRDDPGWGSAKAIRLNSKSSRIVMEKLGITEKKPPLWLYQLSREQAKVFIETYVKGDGYTEKRENRVRITTTDKEIKDAIVAVAILAGYNVSISVRIPNLPSKKAQYIITLTKTGHEYIQEIREVDYSGVIWSVNTENETVIAMRNGSVFITGNTPFTNFTVTLDAPKKMLDGDHAVYAGEKVEPLGEYEKEAKEFFVALTEVLREGDALGQPFTFPIPTLMVTAKMLWDDPEVFEAVFGTASKRGSFYWLNTNVVDPDASYAMCLYENEKVLYRADGGVGVAPIKELFERFAGELESREDDGAEWYGVRDAVEVLAVDLDGGKVKWKPVKRFLKKEYGKAIRVRLSDGRSFVVSPDHPIPVLVKYDNSVRLMRAEELAKRSLSGYAYRIPVVLTEIEGEKAKLQLEDGREIDVDDDFGYFLGLFYGDGTFIRSSNMARRTREEKHRGGYYLSGIQFSINSEEKDVKEFLVQFSINVLGKEPKVKRDPRWESLTYVIIYDAYLARALYDEGVSGLSHEKRIPGVIWHAPAGVRRAFLKGLLHSDGYWRKGAWELHIKNRELAEDVLTLAAITRGSAYFRENRDGSVVVYFPGSWGEEIGRPSDAVKHRVDGNLAWVTVVEVEEIEVNGTFYDVEVEGIHYFTHSSGVVTHNCCRIAIDKTEMAFAFGVSGKSAEEEALERLERGRFGGLWAMPDVTGSVNVTTVNLPRLALKANGDDNRFWEEYERILEVVRRTTDWFRERYVRLITAYRHMYSMIHLYLQEFPSSHFNTVGILGLPEAAAIYLNEPELWEEGTRKDWMKAAELMKEMVEFATAKAREWMRESGTPWNVEEVPGESAAAKLAIKDLHEFPELREYLSDPENPIYSTSVAPYYGSLELADRIRVEEKVQRSFTGGVMMHIFLGEEPDPEALAKLTKRLMRTQLVYWSYTPAVTVCNACGYSTTGLHTHCPRCGSENVEVWSRIIGYYRPLKNWNPFRKKEFWTRRHYSS